MKKSTIVAGAAVLGAGAAYVAKKKKEEIKEKGDVIFKRIYPQSNANNPVAKKVDALKDKLEDFQINVLCAADVPLEYLKKTTENLKGDLVNTTENFKRFMERSESKLSSELIKAQMNIKMRREEDKEAAEAKAYATQKEKDAALVKTEAETATLLNEYALQLMEDAMTTSIAAQLLAKQYEETYGETCDIEIQEALANLPNQEEKETEA